jgi:hypothetical protein
MASQEHVYGYIYRNHNQLQVVHNLVKASTSVQDTKSTEEERVSSD